MVCHSGFSLPQGVSSRPMQSVVTECGSPPAIQPSDSVSDDSAIIHLESESRHRRLGRARVAASVL